MQKLPEKFIERMKKQLPETEWAAFFACYDKKPFKGVRLNPLRGSRCALKPLLPFLGAPVAWEENGYYTNAERVGADPFHFAGVFYSQEPSAMCAAPLLEVKAGEKVLDLCSAPGGKGTQLACAMDGKGIIVLNEPISSRAKILSHNVERMGVKNAVVLNEYPATLASKFTGYFDKILVDAPCSGEGMFRRQSEAIAEWSENAPRGCADRQMEILAEAAKMLAPGGVMVYSTCTFNDTENEGVLARFIQAHPEFSLEPFSLPGLPSGERGYAHLYPHEIEGEGHFVSLLRKSPDAPGAAPVPAAPAREKRPARGKETPKKKAAPGIALPDVLAGDVTFGRLHTAGESLWALPDGLDDISRLSGLRVLRTGLLLAHQEGKRAEPDHALAMALRPHEAARTAELNEEQALLYQAGEALNLGELENGYTLLTLHGVSLGFGKQAGGVMKNHYPKGLRRR